MWGGKATRPSLACVPYSALGRFSWFLAGPSGAGLSRGCTANAHRNWVFAQTWLAFEAAAISPPPATSETLCCDWLVQGRERCRLNAEWVER